MADRPILFSAPMVLALLAGTKTQTRRVLTIPKLAQIVDMAEIDPELFGSLAINDPSRWGDPFGDDGAPMDLHSFPRIKVGDRLWVRETWTAKMVHGWTIADARSGRYQTQLVYRADGADSIDGWWPAIRMPREFSRITLTVTDVRVQRLHEISEVDALAEGCKAIREFCYVFDSTAYGRNGLCHSSPVIAYSTLWDEINGPGSWDANPWVAAYTFTVALGNIDKVSA